MTMFTAILLTLLPVTAQAQPSVGATSAADPSRLAVGRRIVLIVLPPAQREQMFAAILTSMMKSTAAGLEAGTGLDKELAASPAKRAVFDRFIERQRQLATADINAALPQLVEAYARAYARQFPLEELQKIEAFVSTPAGAHFVQRGPALIADPDVAGWQRKLTEQGAARQRDELAKLQADMAAATSQK